MVGRTLFGACLLVAVIVRPTIASSQEAPSRDQSANTGNDFFRPPSNLFQMMTYYKTAPGSGSTKGSITNVTTETFNLRYDHALDLAPMWILALRSDLPLLAKNPISSSNPDGDYLYGAGDADVQAAVIHNLSQRWAVGFGARLIAPTGGDTFGSGKWQIMPIVGARYALWEINSSSYIEPIVRYDVSFAGDPTKRNISNLQFAPTFNLGLPDRWFITFYPSADIRINFGDPITGQTGRLFLPFDARIGRKLSDNVALSFELGVPIIRDYPVYNIKTQVRLNVTY
ncbi:Putative MetA-pathway of phenol degradation [Bradyrhizobium canariense]|uniref:Putative MetA-pathway of phenol degradation n=2 Tax=Bradyrhizobium canariense TaxID=255045 RepID=A0A1H1US82_9BRAD|nr:Putative MetA-pathway of phenol degradation [Bradyrhizobium canariense]